MYGTKTVHETALFGGKWFFLNNWLDYKSCTVFILFLRLLQQICFRSKNNRWVSKQFSRQAKKNVLVDRKRGQKPFHLWIKS